MEKKMKANSLNSNGEIIHKNTYVRIKNMDYLDIICRFCESTTILIPFSVCDVTERKRIFAMDPAERIKYSIRFRILDNLD